LTVPGGMGGKEAIKKLLEIDPATIAIVSSGYSDDPVLTNFQEYGFKGLLPKPYEFRSLGKVLQEVLKDEYD
jgi:DNA-binding NarL/FixJ family response regulator